MYQHFINLYDQSNNMNKTNNDEHKRDASFNVDNELAPVSNVYYLLFILLYFSIYYFSNLLCKVYFFYNETVLVHSRSITSSSRLPNMPVDERPKMGRSISESIVDEDEPENEGTFLTFFLPYLVLRIKIITTSKNAKITSFSYSIVTFYWLFLR